MYLSKYSVISLIKITRSLIVKWLASMRCARNQSIENAGLSRREAYRASINESVKK